MIAAIYARKSTEQAGVADEQKSVARQVEHATAYARRHGWTVDPQFVFVDDGISGAEFARRPGFVRLMNALQPRPPFRVLVMSEQSRLGREMVETAYALKKIRVAGVRIFTYLDDREHTLDTPTEKFISDATAFADELEREKARLRVTDAMIRRARAGHCCGAACFGYDRVEIKVGDRRSHVERRINAEQAAVVRRIFDLSAAGYGYTSIAKRLNAEQAPAPKQRRRRFRIDSWAPTSVKEILDRRLYRGELVWNRTRRTRGDGRKQSAARPEQDWITVAVPDLRIVTDEQWHAAHVRLTTIRSQMAAAGAGFVIATANGPVESKYLLPGFAHCACCGGSLGVVGGGGGRSQRYGCLVYHKRGTALCGNHLRMPLHRVDVAVLQKLAGSALRPPVVRAIVDGVLEQITPMTYVEELERRRVAVHQVEHSITRLARAIAEAGDFDALLAELKRARAERDELLAIIATLERTDVRRFDRSAVVRRIDEHVAHWRELLATKRVEDGRQLLREVLAGPLRFTPEQRSYRFEGELRLGEIVAGMAGLPTDLVAVRGIEPRFDG